MEQITWLLYITNLSARWKPMSGFGMKHQTEMPMRLFRRSAHDIITTERKLRVRWNISYQLTREVTLRNRIEWSQYGQDGGTTENGYLLYQDVVYKPWELPFSLACRYTFSAQIPITPVSMPMKTICYMHTVLPIFMVKGNGFMPWYNTALQAGRYPDQIWSDRLYRPRYYWQRK